MTEQMEQNDRELVRSYLEEYGEEEACPYCKYHSDCHGLSSGPNGPIFPPFFFAGRRTFCADAEDLLGLLDVAAFAADIRKGEI